MPLDPSVVDALQALSLGFAFAGLVASTFELITDQTASFHLLQSRDVLALASVPVLVFCAPFVIARNTVRGCKLERRPFHLVILAPIVACLWSLMCGRLVLDVTQALAIG